MTHTQSHIFNVAMTISTEDSSVGTVVHDLCAWKVYEKQTGGDGCDQSNSRVRLWL